VGDSIRCLCGAKQVSGISIIIPVVRPEKAARCVQAVRENSAGHDVEYVSAIDEDGIGCPRMVAQLVKRTRNDFVCFLGDDTIPQPGFLDAAVAEMEKLPGGWGVVGLNTEGSVGYGHWLAHKKMLDLTGGEFFNTEYRHCYCDRELYDVAVENGRWAWAEGARLLHDHPVNGADTDEHYDWIYSSGIRDIDHKTFWRRKQDRIRNRGERRLGICWPLTNTIVYADFAASYAMLEKPGHAFYIPESANQSDIDGGPVQRDMDTVKNSLVRSALDDGMTHLLTMDTDQVYLTRDMIPRMLSHEKQIVAARVHRRYPPFDPIMLEVLTDRNGEKKYKTMDFEKTCEAVKAGALVRVDNTGTGCVLYDTAVFLAIDDPWYEFRVYADGTKSSCDCTFHEKCVDAGIEIYVDAGVEVLHMTTHGVGMGDYMLQHFRQTRQEQPKQTGVENGT